MSITFHQLTPAEFMANMAELRDLYFYAFSEQPYAAHASDFAEAFQRTAITNLERPGFTCWIARYDKEIVGLTYGHRVPPSWWLHRSVEPQPAWLATSFKFFVVEWAVHPAHRGISIGRKLLHLLLDSQHDNHAVLVTNPEAHAINIYRRHGWRDVGSTSPQGIWPLMRILALDMAEANSASMA